MKEDGHCLAFLPFSLRLACAVIVPVIFAPLHLIVPTVTFARPA